MSEFTLQHLVPRPVMIGTAALTAIIGLAVLLPADDGAQPANLAKDMVGTWIQAGTPEKVEDPPPAKGPLKFLTGKHWTFTQADPETGKVVYHHGGTYTLDSDNYAETIHYANESTANMIGQTLKFKLKVDGDTLTQVGIGNPYTQIWKRAK